MGKKPVDPFVRAQTVALDNAGFKQVDTSTRLEISLCFVQNAITKFKNDGHYNDMKRSGRPKKITGDDIRYLKKLVRGDVRPSASKVTSELNISLPNPVSVVPVPRYLKYLGYEYVVKSKRQ
ncbi:hypothetical protein I4U23_012351 [Adineta vaga]|nr:hypothetical protein I4U23_012351 [Adineta vaga]